MRKTKLRKENPAKRKINDVAEKKGTEVKGTGETLSKVESTMDWKKELVSFLRQMRDEGRAIAEEMKAKGNEGTGEGQRNQGELVAEQIFRSKMAATEDGADLRTFLSLMEQEFREMKISEDQWGLLVRKYLIGRAVKQWDYIYRSGIDMTNWSLVRERLCERFRVLPRESMISKMKENVWKGDYNEYTNAFTDIVITGEEMPEEELAIFFLAGLPEDIGDRLTKRGKREFPTWHEAAKALREYVVPMNAWRTKRKRAVREMQSMEGLMCPAEGNAKAEGEKNAGKAEGSNGITRRVTPSVRVATDGERDVIRCYECTGRGHLGRDCPLRNGVIRRRGETCSKCGGKDHYARDCATARRITVGGQRVNMGASMETREGVNRSNEKA
ncbi:uncharacterized protein EMH_0087950 [Eimeria mitis]|uniref:CCHC-type domain-containing protein n=1 Tax=Eimeria mitis TaxID=44415 RepID=U6KI86_9EIME|nr:uncharacterized protein EMH_0087950 [Eimeria mitis]CDJ36501.1 hypothetical protein EMH_0087950 [Eimeria mitis]